MDSQSAELIALRSKAPSLYHYNFATILTAITKEKIIPTFTLRKCMQIAESNGLSGLLQSQECKDLVSFFESIGLPPQVGYNPGTGLISLKFPLPNPRELRKPISSYSKALVFCALGLHHQQHAFEYDFINLQRTYYTLQQKHNSLQPFDIISYALDAKHVPPAHLGRGKTGCAETIYNILSSSDLIHSVTIPSRPDTSVQTELLSQLLQVSTAQGENKEKDKTNQESVENRNSSTATERVSPDQLVSLANVSLYNFFRQSHIMIANLNIDAPSQTCTLFLRPAKFGYIMNKPAKSGALHPLRPLLSFVEVSPQTNDIEYHIISQYQHYLHRIQQSESLTVSLHKGSNSTAALPSKDPKNIDNDGEYERNPEPKLSFELYQRYFFDFVIPIYKSDDSVVPFTFSPIYSLITGHNPVTMRRDTTYLQQQHKFIISLLQSYFWHYITSTERYYPTAILRTQMNTVLERYFQTGLDSFRCGFNPQLRNLSLFLWGTAGTGKSTFVRVLCATLHEIIDHIFEPGKRVEITRMPFNQTTPAALAALLMVRGISDWSLERIVEQTVSRGGLSLLHLEEQPPDPAIQDELYGLITKMTTTLVSRYPEYRHNVINILTANYPPSNDLSNTTNVIEITPPNRTTQQIWICKTAEDMIASSLVRLDTGNVRFSLSCLELCPLVQFISHPSDKPPYVTSQWPNGISGSGSGNGTNEQGNGNSTNGKGSNNITTSLNGIPALSHTFHTTIQRPLYSISARMNEPGFDQQYLTQYYKYNNLNNYSQMSSFQQHNQSSQTTPMLDTFLNFFGFETQPNKGANSSNMKQSLGNINGNVHNTPSLDDEFKYSKLLPFLQQYQYDLTMPSPLIALLPPELSSVLIGDGPHEQQFISQTPGSSPKINVFQEELNISYLQFNIHIELISPPPFTFDLRKLEGWKRSISYAILQHLTSHITICAALCGLITNSTPMDEVYNINPDNSIEYSSLASTMNNEFDRLKYILPQTLLSLAFVAQISQNFDQLKNRYVITIDFDAYDHIGFRQRATYSPQQYKEYQRRCQNYLYKQQLALIGANKWGTPILPTQTQLPSSLLTDELAGLLPPLTLVSLDGYFFHPEYNFNTSPPHQPHLQQPPPSFPSPQALTEHANQLQQRFQSNVLTANSTVKASIPSTRHVDPSLPLTVFELARIHAIVAMWKSLFLQPAVIVVVGPPNETANVIAYVHNLIHSQCYIPEINHFPSQEHITSKDNALFPSINTNMTYNDSLVLPIDVNHFACQQPSQQLPQDDVANGTDTQEQQDQLPLQVYPHEDCIVSPPFAYDTFLEVVRAGNDIQSRTPRSPEEPMLTSQMAQSHVLRHQNLHNDQHHHDDEHSRRTLPKLFPFYALARHEQHKLQLFGEPDPSRSILTRFITQVQTHHIPKQSVEFNPVGLPPLSSQPVTPVPRAEIKVPHALGAIFIAANGQGQFYFRDLIDAGESNTHVTKTHKDGLLFVLAIDNTQPEQHDCGGVVQERQEREPITAQESVADGDLSTIYAVQPQVISRSQIVINIPNKLTHAKL
jgi:hypothetical protein